MYLTRSKSSDILQRRHPHIISIAISGRLWVIFATKIGVSAPLHATKYSYSSITEETKMTRWMSSGSLLQDAHLTSLPQFIHLYVPGKVGCSREVRELGWGWSSLLRYTKEAMVFDLGRYQPTQSHFNSEVRATRCSPYTHRQFPGSCFALESRVLRG